MMRDFSWLDIQYMLWMTRETLLLTALAFAGGSLLGLIITLGNTSQSVALRFISAAYIQIIQATPVLLLLFCIYYGLPLLGFDPPGFVAAGLGLSLYASSFLAEVWRGAIQAVPRQQWEAGASLGLSLVQQRVYVIFPQALRAAIPPTVGFLVQILKNTSVASIIGFVELTRAAQLINNATFEPFKAFGTAGVIYLLLCFPLAQLGRLLERKMHGYRQRPTR